MIRFAYMQSNTTIYTVIQTILLPVEISKLTIYYKGCNHRLMTYLLHTVLINVISNN